MAIHALILLCYAGLPAAGRADPVFDLAAILAPPLEARVLAKAEKGGVVSEEVLYRSEMDGPKRVDVFAYFSYPKGGKSLPAVVWAMPGLAPANTWWPEFFAKRGYAALCVEYPMKGYRGTGQYEVSMDMGTDPRAAGICHAAVAFLRGVSYLQTRPEVDRERIGIAGSSWGGFFATLMVGLDSRLKVGASFFGAGNLTAGCGWWGGPGHSSKDPAFLSRWQATLDPAIRLPNRKTPIGWFTGTNDVFFWMPSVMKTYDMATGPKHLALLPGWNHALSEPLDNEVFTWLDAHLRGTPPLLVVDELVLKKSSGRVEAVWNYSGPRRVTKAELILSYGDDGNWGSRCWKRLRAKFNGSKCSLDLPHSPLAYYVGGNVIDSDGFISSTPLVRIDSRQNGLYDPQAPMDYDGAAMWGGFENEEAVFLQRSSLSCPERSHDAKAGSYSAAIGGHTVLHLPLLFTTGVPHRLKCAVKAERPAELTLVLEGSFDGKPLRNQKAIRSGTTWTPVSLDVSLPAAF